MSRLNAFVRGFCAVFNFTWLIPGMYEPTKLIEIKEIPQHPGVGEAILSYWRNVGGYMRTAMDQVQKEHSDAQKTQE